MDALGPSDVFLFEDFRLDRCGLFRREESGAFVPAKIGSRALDILQMLIQRADELVSKEEIVAAVWPGTVVEDSNLTVQISALRHVSTRDLRRVRASRRSRGAAIASSAGDARRDRREPRLRERTT